MASSQSAAAAAKPRPKRQMDPRVADDLKRSSEPEHQRKTLFIGNMDYRLTEYALIKAFQPFGTIARCTYLWHKEGPQKGKPRGYAFIEYETIEAAKAAQMALDKKEMCGRKIIVRSAITQDYGPSSLEPKPAKPQTKHRSAADKIRLLEAKLAALEHRGVPKRSAAERGAAPARSTPTSYAAARRRPQHAHRKRQY